MAQQTAVDWLVEQLLGGKLLMPSLIEKAKQMEKEQMKSAFNQGYRDAESDCCQSVDTDVSEFANAEEYYNKTFGK